MTEQITLTGDETMKLGSIMSDIQEMTEDKRIIGYLNLIKGVLWGRVKIETEDGFSWRFKSINPNSRFCDNCGLLKEGVYKQCKCGSV